MHGENAGIGKNFLAVSDESLEKLLNMSDKILEMNACMELAVASAVKDETKFELLSKISAMEQQIASLQIQRSRPRNQSSHHRRASRSRSLKRFDPQGKLCFYHFRFGKTCVEPCAWKESGNSSQ